VTVALGRWAERAACRRFPADWWHSDDPWDRERAASVCGECPVQRECLAYAQGWWDRRNGLTGPAGIWGGWLFLDGDMPAPVGAPQVAAPPIQRPPLQPCGTTAAYQRHRDHGEPPCLPCLTASKTGAAARNRKMRVRKAEAKLWGTA